MRPERAAPAGRSRLVGRPEAWRAGRAGEETAGILSPCWTEAGPPGSWRYVDRERHPCRCSGGRHSQLN